jgi:hypothetical protein
MKCPQPSPPFTKEIPRKILENALSPCPRGLHQRSSRSNGVWHAKIAPGTGLRAISGKAQNGKGSQHFLRYACSEFYHKQHGYASCRLLRQFDRHPLAGLHSISRMAGRTISWSSTVTGNVGQFSMAVSTSLLPSPTRMVSSDFAPVMDGFQA